MKSIKKAANIIAVCGMSAIIAIILQTSAETGIRTNEEGLELIGNVEGCRRDAYICPAGRWTQGVGSTHNVNKDVLKTDEEIAADFAYNIQTAEQCLNVYGNGEAAPDNVFSAMTSFVFNVGCGKSRGYTIFAKFKEGKYADVCELFPIYDKATINGVKVAMRGLTERRLKEKALCMKDIV